MLISDILYTKSSVLDKCAFVYMVCIFTAIFPVMHDLRVLDIHFSPPFVYIDIKDFLRENGEVGPVLGIRERP